jgi:hypothetical protein
VYSCDGKLFENPENRHELHQTVCELVQIRDFMRVLAVLRHGLTVVLQLENAPPYKPGIAIKILAWQTVHELKRHNQSC